MNHIGVIGCGIILVLVQGCASSKPFVLDDVSEPGRTMFESRVAHAVRFDEAHAARMAQLVETIRAAKRPYMSDKVALVYALDELAEIYTTRLVNFDRAAQVNDEAAALFPTIDCCDNPHHLRAYVYSRNRLLYNFAFRNYWQLEERERYDLLTTVGQWVYPGEFLTYVARDDFDRLWQRVQKRKQLLQRILRRETGSHSANTSGTELVPENFVQEEAAQWRSLLDAEHPGESAVKSIALLERVWRLRERMTPVTWARQIDAAGAAAMLSEASSEQISLSDKIKVRFRTGYAKMKLGKVSDAVSLFDAMLKFVTAQDQQLQQNYQQAQRGLTLDKIVASAKALAGFPFSLPGFSVVGDLVLRGYFRDSVGDLWHAIDKSNRLPQLYGEQATALPMYLNEHERLAFHSELGYGYDQMGRVQEAIQQYKKAITLIERQRASLGTESKRVQFLQDKEIVYTRLIKLLARQGDRSGVLEYMEHARSRAFVDLLASGRPKFGTKKENDQYESTQQEVAAQELLVQNSGVAREDSEMLVRALRGVQVVADTPTHLPDMPSVPAAQTVAKISAEFESLANVTVASASEIVAALGRDAALLSFFVTDENTIILLAQDGDLSVWERPMGRRELQERVARLRTFLETPSSKGDRDGITYREAAAKFVSDLLVDCLKVIRKPMVYVAPHGPLHYLPIAALHDGAGYLLDRFAVMTVPSGTVLTYLARKTHGAGDQTVVFANPDLGNPDFDLPFAEHEGAAIRMKRPSAVLLTRQAAQEAQVKSQAATAAVLHFATHGEFSARTPLDSGLLLAKGGGQDGKLTAAEAFGLQLPGALVVLSGCETALGAIASGDEMLGLTRAFMYAGAPRLIATLWKIDDEGTSMLMELFYTNLTNRQPAEALRQAQIELRKRRPHPYYWAPFSFSGVY